jgi:3',5'-cyclic AMP phosphodiesterase CpdA
LPPFRLAHLSDLHLPPPGARLSELAPKRLLSRFAWRRKRYRHAPANLAALVEDVATARPDHIAVTGDLTNFATKPELAAARDWLETLGPSQDVTVSPGNHDALVAARGDPFAVWRPWLGDDDDGFPQVRRRGPVAIVNLCSGHPTALHLAQGVLDAGQLSRLPRVLQSTEEAGLFRVVLIHHPPTPGVVSHRKALRDAGALLSILEREGAELVLHGHVHAASVTSASGPSGPIPVLGVPSASGAGGHEEAARWHEFAIERDGAWRVGVTARGFGGGEHIRELGRYTLQPGRV